MRTASKRTEWRLSALLFVISSVFACHLCYALSALHLTASTPINNSDDAARIDTVAVLTFSAPLNASTVSPNHVALRSGNTVTPVTVNAVGNQIIIKAVNELLPATSYTLAVSGVQGSNGELLSSPISISFKTRDGAWQTAQQIDNHGHVFFNSNAIVSNKQGNAIAIWRRLNSASGYDLIASQYLNGQWNAPVRVNSNQQGDVLDADIAISKEGNAIAVWEQAGNGGTNTPARIWANVFSASGGWGVPQRIDTDSTQGGIAPRIAIAPDGNAIAVWSQTVQDTSRIFASRYTPAGWESAVAIDAISHAPGSTNPRIAFDTKGNAQVIWQQVWHGTSLIWGNPYIANRGWIAPQIVQSNWNYSSTNPQLAFDGSGNAFAVWKQSNGIYAGHYTQAQGWGSSVALSNVVDSRIEVYSPSLAVNAKGDAIVVWGQFDPQFNQTVPVDSIWGTHFTNGNWEAPVLLQYPNRLDAFVGPVAIDEAGNALAVWEGYNSSIWRIYAARYQIGYGWVGRKVIDTYNTASASSPQIAVDGSGNALVVWEQTAPGTAVDFIWTNQFK